jgi:ferric-dicitrate binding protein FerR (iron transport regulator)
MDKTLIEKYLNNRCNEQELEMVLSWFRDSASRADGRVILHRIWEEFPENDINVTTDLDSILDRIHHDINTHQTVQLMENAENDLVRYNRRQYFLKILRNAAAVLIIPVLGLTSFFTFKYFSARTDQASASQAYNEVFSSIDAITKVSLPDGSNVWLNHSSSLRYPAVFNGKSRKVELKGEGYFEVANNPKLPFLVIAEEIQVLAHGTTFNIMAYPDEDKVETSLINGSVELVRSLPDGNTITLYRMNPTDYSIYYKGNDVILTKTIGDNRYFSWKEGKLIFTAEPMEEVVKKLSRWFNVDIKIKDPELRNLTLTATFVHETLPQVMELLTIVSPVRYTISKREENNDGTFTRTKVIIRRR